MAIIPGTCYDQRMKTICIESPYAGSTELEIANNVSYAMMALDICLRSGLSPYACHLQNTLVLSDSIPEERERGICAGIELGNRCDERWVFVDLGITPGMLLAIKAAEETGQPVVYVSLDEFAYDTW